tara:strand:- start:2339 stop:2470 length:132 start_codon:yes stop_codon:yes gene_type:complete
MSKLGVKLSIVNTVLQTARLARDLWKKIIDTFANEQRLWKDIV